MAEKKMKNKIQISIYDKTKPLYPFKKYGKIYIGKLDVNLIMKFSHQSECLMVRISV